MTKITEILVHKLCGILEDNKYLLLTGGLGVGKTFLAKKIAEKSVESKYGKIFNSLSSTDSISVCTQIVPIHSAYGYEDFVCGMVMQTTQNGLVLEYKDKIFLEMIKQANTSWDNDEFKKYILILDDINRGSITGVLGDTLNLIEPHGNGKYKITTKDGFIITIPPNFYIIATKNTVIETPYSIDYAFIRRFYSYTIDSDYQHIEYPLSNLPTNKFDTSAYSLYKKINIIIKENLSYRYRRAVVDGERFILGQGMFSKEQYIRQVKYQVIPILKQFLKDGILDLEANIAIGAVDKLLMCKYSKSYCGIFIKDRIKINKTGITASTFLIDGVTHNPLVNLISRIKEQGILSDVDIENSILFNENILYRRMDNNNIIFDHAGYLYAPKAHVKTIKLGNRYLYKSRECITIDNAEYCIAGEMQPKEFNRWTDDYLLDNYINERNSTSPNTVLFMMIKNYYNSLLKNYKSYLVEQPDDSNIELLMLFAKKELEKFIEDTKNIIPDSGSSDDNLNANEAFRKLISELVLLWTNRNDYIEWDGRQIQVEGVYKLENVLNYKEYMTTMDSLGINQMILQGPPGTSKTFSTKGFLKYVGKGIENDDMLSDDELNSFQISNYLDEELFSEWKKMNPNEKPKIAWDIVQFHPSYGYEDFIRGIEVSTKKDGEEEDSKSFISYDTVNKILGKMASLAWKNGHTKFFLVIDEINRANLATVFGELIYGLEYRGEGVATPYTVGDSNKLLLPDNLYIIGTMNTADKSIGGIDYAIRRRFLFFSLLPDREVISNYLIKEGMSDDEKNNRQAINYKALLLFDKISILFDGENLNSEYYKEDVQIGHTYFLVDNEEQLFMRFKYQLIPILREYYKDGMFQFESDDNSKEGWEGLLNCISGKININKNPGVVKNIFDSLTSNGDNVPAE